MVSNFYKVELKGRLGTTYITNVNFKDLTKLIYNLDTVEYSLISVSLEDKIIVNDIEQFIGVNDQNLELGTKLN